MSKDNPQDQYGDLPVAEAIAKAEDLIDRGATVYFKFTCGKCGQRLGFDKANTLWFKGTCDKCGYTTEIKKCGFMVVFGLRKL